MWSNLQGNINDGIVNQVCAVRVFNTGNIGTGGSFAALSFNSERYDGESLHSSGAPTQLIAQTAGIYRVGAGVEWPTDAGSGRCHIGLRVNGSIWIARATMYANPSSSAYQTISCDWLFAASDYVEILASSANSLTIQADSDFSPEFWMSRV